MQKAAKGLDFTVLLSGIGTSAIVLLLVNLLDRAGFNPMGFYLFLIVPVGALLVGLAAGSGYAIASRVKNVFVDTYTKIAIFILGVFTYILAQYMTYRGIIAANDIPPDAFSFLDYIKLICESTTYNPDMHNPDGSFELGKFGYLLQLIECAGFALGGVIPLLILGTTPYCHRCQLYKKHELKVFICSDETKDALKKQKKKAKAEIIQKALDSVAAVSNPVLEQIEANSLEENRELLGGYRTKPNTAALVTLTLELMKCPNCDEHTVTATMQNVTADGRTNMAQARKIDVSTGTEMP